MTFRHCKWILLGIAGLAVCASAGWSQSLEPYYSPESVIKECKQITGLNKGLAELKTLTTTPGGRDLVVLELGAESGDKPAVMIAANMEGDYPLATTAALRLARLLVTDWKSELETCAWIILPMGNPDGYSRLFDSPRVVNRGNARAVNDDLDDATDEDGPDDLNGDGFITRMRYEHPDGNWIEVKGNPLLMKRADAGKEETGKYRLVQEGLDNDGDGEINEDGPGGVNVGRNFPHRFEHYRTENGPWAASEKESRAVLEYTLNHPEIALVIVFGRSNSLREVPEGSRSSVRPDSYEIPEWIARRFGLDPDDRYSIDFLLPLAKSFFGQDITEDRLIQWLDGGAAMSPHRSDVEFWGVITEKYSKFLEANDRAGKRLDPPEFPPGSFDEWAYYQFGVPCFSMDFWTLPEMPKKEEDKSDTAAIGPSLEELESMSAEDFLSLGKEKIAAFLEANNVPKRFSAEMVITGLESGQMTPRRMAKMIAGMSEDKDEDGGGDKTEEALFAYNPDAFVAWEAYEHPTLGAVEIGGMKPYATVLPEDEAVESLIDTQLPFLRTLIPLLAKMTFENIEIEKISDGVYRIDVWVTNDGLLPYPTHQGVRNRRPIPASVKLEGDNLTFLEGRQRQVVRLLPGSGGTTKVSWLVAGRDGATVSISLDSGSAGSATESVALKGGN